MDETILFEQYKKTGDVALRNQIVEKYLYIAEIIAKKFVGRGVPFDDLFQEASLSLLRGIERFDPSLGLKFSTFITPTITGELRNYFRDKTRPFKVPRRLGELNAAVRKYVDGMETETGKKPTVKEVALALSVSEEDVVKAMEIGGTLSLDALTETEDDGYTLSDLLPTEESDFEKFEVQQTLAAAMDDFSDAEKKLVKYRFVDGLSQMQTAQRLGVSQMFVSRSERKVLAKLKDRLKGVDV
jgi:RNA polymerase sigma-B factor